MNHFHTPSFGDECLDLTSDVAEPSSSSAFMQLQAPIYMHMNDGTLQQQQEQTQRMRTMDDGSAAAYPNDPNITADNMTNVDLCNGLLGTPQQLMRPQTLASRKQLAGVTDGGDPNEPTKPLSAYSLFFRDTVSTIKQQNPNSSYNDLLRIVANMWDLLDEQRKSIYLNKHEMAMQEYIRQMNEYQQKQQAQGGHQQQHVPSYQLQQHDAAMGMQQQQQPHDIFNDPLTSGGVLVNGQPMHQMPTTTPALSTTPSAALQTKPAVFTIQPNQQQNITDATMMPSDVSLGGTTSSSYNQLSSSLPLQHETSSAGMQSLQPTAGDNFFNESNDTSLNAGHFQMTDSLATQQQQQSQQQQLQQQQTASNQVQSQMLTSSSLNSSQQVDNTQDQQTSAPPPEHEITPSVMPQVPQLCIRDSCTKPAILNINWDDEYCSNECVVAHCRNVFTTWVEENRREAEQLRQQQQQQFQQQHQQQQQQQLA